VVTCTAATSPPARGSRRSSRSPPISATCICRQQIRATSTVRRVGGCPLCPTSMWTRRVSVLWCRGWHHAERSNHSWVDHHDQHQQRHSATTPATSSGAAAGRRASRTRSSPGGFDGRGDSGAAAYHRASARTATASRTTTTATGLAAHANDAGDGAPCQD
jgi:hypothetical protein